MNIPPWVQAYCDCFIKCLEHCKKKSDNGYKVCRTGFSLHHIKQVKSLGSLSCLLPINGAGAWALTVFSSGGYPNLDPTLQCSTLYVKPPPGLTVFKKKSAATHKETLQFVACSYALCCCSWKLKGSNRFFYYVKSLLMSIIDEATCIEYFRGTGKTSMVWWWPVLNHWIFLRDRKILWG